MQRQAGFRTRRWLPLSRITVWRGSSGTTSRMEGDEVQIGTCVRRPSVDTKVSTTKVEKNDRDVAHWTKKVLYTRVPLMAHCA